MNIMFYANHCMEYWRHKTGCRCARKVRGYTPPSDMYLNREDVCFSIEADGTHVFLRRNAEKLGYTRDYTSTFRNRYRRAGLLPEVGKEECK